MGTAMSGRIGGLILVAAFGGLVGCTTPASREAMSAPAASVNKKYPYSVFVEARGGSETNAVGISNISDSDLKAAIETSILRSGLFERVIQGKAADYELTVTLVPLVLPLFGASFTVNMEAGWLLVRAKDRSVVMRTVVKSAYTADMGEAVVGATRLRLAIEGAARNNISSGLQAIAALGL